MVMVMRGERKTKKSIMFGVLYCKNMFYKALITLAKRNKCLMSPNFCLNFEL